MLPESQRELIRRRCEFVLRQNWREGIRTGDRLAFAYTCPSPRRYPWQWYWDSCCHAIAWRRFDRDRAKRELVSCWRRNGPTGSSGTRSSGREPLRGSRRYTYNVLTSADPMTASIQPPMLAWAWRIAVGDPAAEPRIARQHDWLAGAPRPWMTTACCGSSPRTSRARTPPTSSTRSGATRPTACPGTCDSSTATGGWASTCGGSPPPGGPVCCEVVTNVLYNLSRLALGRPSLTPALIERTYDARRGLFVPRARPAPRRTPAVTIAALAPLALPDLPEDIGRRLVEEHLLNPDRFWTAVPPPSVSVDEPSFTVNDHGLLRQRRYWRGPTWINTAWLCWLGLVRLGYDEPAAQLGAAARVRGGGGGAARVLRPLHRGGHGGAGLRVVEPGAGAARARPRGRPHQLPRRDARGLASSPWTHSET